MAEIFWTIFVFSAGVVFKHLKPTFGSVWIEQVKTALKGTPPPPPGV